MATKAGYWVDLFGIQFSDDQAPTWIQAMPLGTYEHPVHGSIDITPERVSRFADNVKANVRGQQLDIDYDHKEYSGQAAGWVTDAEARSDGLWILVEWTKKAYEAIKSKAYRYFSPEFVDEWTHPKNQQTFKDVLFGGGLTNRPFLKDILPINMSEVFAYVEDTQPTGGKMQYTPEQLAELRKKYELSDDATIEDILAAAVAAGEDDAGGTGANGATGAGENPSGSIEANEVPDAIKKLAESNPAVKALMDIINVQGKQLEANTKALKEAQVAGTVAKLTETATKKGFALAPTATAALSEVLLEAPQQLSDKVVQAFDKVVTGLVELGERGKQRQGNGTEVTGAAKFAEVVKNIQASDKDLSYADAVVRAASQDPDAFAAYQAESYAFRI